MCVKKATIVGVEWTQDTRKEKLLPVWFFFSVEEEVETSLFVLSVKRTCVCSCAVPGLGRIQE
jgi:hypothetical protein